MKKDCQFYHCLRKIKLFLMIIKNQCGKNFKSSTKCINLLYAKDTTLKWECKILSISFWMIQSYIWDKFGSNWSESYQNFYLNTKEERIKMRRKNWIQSISDKPKMTTKNLSVVNADAQQFIGKKRKLMWEQSNSYLSKIISFNLLKMKNHQYQSLLIWALNFQTES